MELSELTDGITDSIGWAEDACMCISEVWSDAAETWRNLTAQKAFNKIDAAIDLLKEARMLMNEESAKARAEDERSDRDAAQY